MILQPEHENKLTEIMQRVRRMELKMLGLVKESLGGNYHSKFKGQGLEFDDIREYQAGDDVRFLDWNVTARLNEPYIRKYIEERELNVSLIVDISGSTSYGSQAEVKRHYIAELCATFAFSAERNNDKVSLILCSDLIEHYLPPKKGHRHSLRLLRDVLFIQPQSPQTDLVPALELASQRLPHRSLVIIISDFITPTPHFEKRLKALASQHDILCIQITDPSEWTLPPCGRLLMQDPESGNIGIINTSSPALRQYYLSTITNQQNQLIETFKRSNVSHLHLQTNEEILTKVQAYLRNRQH
jgi:uncharacterized protein (DUF58 family)